MQVVIAYYSPGTKLSGALISAGGEIGDLQTPAMGGLGLFQMDLVIGGDTPQVGLIVSVIIFDAVFEG
jgi:hypothetical protein